ncbi:hypothetical protein ACWGIV_28165 [Streptomyces sp. NPDC054844]
MPTSDGFAPLRRGAAQGRPYRVRNKHSGKVLGITGVSTANSAQIVRFTDNGTADHLSRFL